MENLSLISPTIPDGGKLLGILEAGRSEDTGLDPLQPLDVNSIMHQLKNAGRKCGYGKWKWINLNTGELSKFCCNSWECGECRAAISQKYARRAQEGVPDWMVTITLVPSNRKVAQLQWQHMVRALKQGFGRRNREWERLKVHILDVATSMRQEVPEDVMLSLRSSVIAGYTFEYFRVLERGAKSGMRHWHLLLRGSLIPHLVLAGMTSMFGFGKVADIRPVYDGEGAGYYVGKHLGKSGGESGWRKVTSSRRYSLVEGRDVDADWHLSTGAPGEGVDKTMPYVVQFREKFTKVHESSEGE